MPPERQRLLRLRRLERIREIARHHAAQEAARAESTLAQLEALAARTEAMAGGYAVSGPASGHELAQTARFIAGLQAIAQATQNDATSARSLADQRQRELAEAERRRSTTGERAEAVAAAIARRRHTAPLGARRGTGTGFE